jgi:hypothetical protein
MSEMIDQNEIYELKQYARFFFTVRTMERNYVQASKNNNKKLDSLAKDCLTPETLKSVVKSHNSFQPSQSLRNTPP